MYSKRGDISSYSFTLCTLSVMIFFSDAKYYYSCHEDVMKRRNRLILPALVSNRIYVIDTGSDPKAPTIFKVSHNPTLVCISSPV